MAAQRFRMLFINTVVRFREGCSGHNQSQAGIIARVIYVVLSTYALINERNNESIFCPFSVKVFVPVLVPQLTRQE